MPLEPQENENDPFVCLLGHYLQGGQLVGTSNSLVCHENSSYNYMCICSTDNGVMSGAAAAARQRRSRSCSSRSSLHGIHSV